MQWIHDPGNSAPAALLGRELGLSEVIARLLCRRGLSDCDRAAAFLQPRLARLADPFAITHLRAATDRVRQALKGAQSIVVFGDYDVDGVTSTALLVHVLQRFGARPRFYVPRRLDEGYGLSRSALKRVLEDGRPDLFIAVDCGTSSRNEVAWLREQGCDVLILDHHTSKEALPEDAIVVNPHVHDSEDAPWYHLCSVGLVFKLVHGLLKALREAGDELAFEIDLKEYLDLVALGTIADLVPLHDENRIFAQVGLRMLQSPQRPGLFALFEVAGVEMDRAVDPFDISFRLGPRINASGRLDDAARPIAMLLGTELSDCRNTARELDAFNRERQDIEATITREAIRQVEDNWSDAPAFILHSPEWHPGVVGIVASRVSQHFHRPTLILGSEDGLAKGSGRSITGIDLVEALKPCSRHLERWGGHPMAIGVSARVEELDGLREAFCASILEQVGGTLPEKCIRIDEWIRPSLLTGQFLDELGRLAPYGMGNPEPVLAVKGAILRFVQGFGKNHIRFQLERAPGDYLSGVAWRAAESPPPEGVPIDLAFRFHWNLWRDRREPRITLIDWRTT